MSKLAAFAIQVAIQSVVRWLLKGVAKGLDWLRRKWRKKK